MSDTFQFLTKKQLTTKIGGIAKRTASLRQDIHEVLCHAAGHAYEHGDVTNFTRLFDATSGVARKDIAQWVRDFGFATLQKDGTFKLNKKARNEATFNDGAACAEYLMAERRWYETEMTAEDVVKALDVAKRLDSLAAAMEKAAKEGKPVTLDMPAINVAVKRFTDAYARIAAKRNAANASANKPGPKSAQAAPLMIAAE